ncbi:LysR family transcriptional regulator [Saccharopolyspora erythraea]|uniref:LysR family transcriptional regulator n=1 Tax=Saccharopolyspora erythraea TaxID=1836 RepID=UPI001BAC57BD|nr:LysR family transcriptional regulator [Saccharopolyspora erythraea]QUH03402.1 LysR family transcriptional regulator [Saccharopolyspora erythraea]
MALDIRELRMICAIAETGSITRAAARVGLSQPALSTHLHGIEKALGDALFVRSRTGVSPTSFGRRVIDRARIVLSEVDSLFGDLPGAPPPTRPMRLGCAHLACVPSIAERAPVALPGHGVTLHIESSAAVLGDALANGRYDAALVAHMEGHDVPLRRPVTGRALVPRYPIFVALAASHRLAREQRVRLADLCDESWVGPPGADDGSLASLRAACLAAGFEPKVRFEAPSGGARELVAGGHAIRLVDPSWPAPDGAVVLPLDGEPLVGRLVVAWRQDRLTREQAGTLYRELAHAYLAHVRDNPVFHRWWRAHPETHPAV